nr:response regulator [Eubacterium sp.]
MKRLKEKWYAFTLLGILVALTFMVLHNYAIFDAHVKDSTQAIGAGNLARVTEELEAYLDKGMSTVQATAVSVEHMMNENASLEEIENVLKYQTKQYAKEVDEDFTGIYGLFQGRFLDGSGWVPEEGYDPRTREWYKTALEAKGAPVIVSPYLDAKTNTIMVSISKMFTDGESVLSLDVALNEVQKITEEINLQTMGYGFVVDKNGMVVAHKNVDEKGMNYLEDNSEMQGLVSRVCKNQEEYFSTELKGEKVTVFSDTVMNDWRVVMVVSNDALFAESQSTLRKNICIGTTISVLIIVFYILSLVRINQSLRRERASNKRIEEMNQNIIRALVRTIDAKDRYTNGHSLRVAEYSREIAKRMNKSESEQETIYYTGLLHDVGKIRVPGAVINKPGKLTDEEYEQIKVHPVTSYHILKGIYDDKQIALGAKFHHERYDGKGYPNGLKGDNIPEIARIIAVADTYDAMASNRSYRKALPQDIVRSELEKGKGTQFDPEMADIMIEIIDEDKNYTLRESISDTKRVLVVDDDPMNAKMIRFILKDAPTYEIVSVSSGAQALELLDEQRFNIILLDFVMPEMDGFETLSHIQKKCSTPVVLMTGDKNLETLERAAEYGVDDYLTKPFLPLALKEIMHSISD